MSAYDPKRTSGAQHQRKENSLKGSNADEHVAG
jgi:hypothetical protein